MHFRRVTSCNPKPITDRALLDYCFMNIVIRSEVCLNGVKFDTLNPFTDILAYFNRSI